MEHARRHHAAQQHRAAIAAIEEQFPGVMVWWGAATGRWWAYVAGRLVEAGSSNDLRTAILRARGGGYVRA